MKKAIFNGYKQKKHWFNFIIGKEYIVKKESDYEYVTDECDYDVPILPSSDFYDFSITGEEDSIKEPSSINCSVEELAHIKCFINGNLVTEDHFEDVYRDVARAKSMGIETSSIKFEMKFE